MIRLQDREHVKHEGVARDRTRRRGQITVEYAIMFVAILVAIIYAAKNIVRPSVNNFYVSAGNVIDKATHQVDRY